MEYSERCRRHEHDHHDHHHEQHDHHGHRASHRVPFEELREDTVICRCCDITFSKLRDAVEHGAASAEEVAERTSSQFACRKCVDYMESVTHWLKIGK